jgi:hypothetical protein
VNSLGIEPPVRAPCLGSGNGATDPMDNPIRTFFTRLPFTRSTLILTANRHAAALELASCNIFRYLLDNLFDS